MELYNILKKAYGRGYDKGKKEIPRIDDFAMAQEIKKQIESWGNQVRLIEDFQNIIVAFAEYVPHLVVIDIMLPFYNGYHWFGEIRRISSIPVVFLSSALDNMNIVMAMNMGGDDFIAKPVDLMVLTTKIGAAKYNCN